MGCSSHYLKMISQISARDCVLNVSIRTLLGISVYEYITSLMFVGCTRICSTAKNYVIMVISGNSLSRHSKINDNVSEINVDKQYRYVYSPYCNDVIYYELARSLL